MVSDRLMPLQKGAHYFQGDSYGEQGILLKEPAWLWLVEEAGRRALVISPTTPDTFDVAASEERPRLAVDNGIIFLDIDKARLSMEAIDAGGVGWIDHPMVLEMDEEEKRVVTRERPSRAALIAMDRDGIYAWQRQGEQLWLLL